MHIFEREDMPPPRPLSCLPFGSGELRMERKMGTQSERERGREEMWMIGAREVPPR